MRGKFITLEGIDGAGKSSHLAFIAERLKQGGIDVVQTREPGGTEVGEAIRALLLDRRMHPETEVLMAFASRREQMALVIEPALSAGRWVICDRFSDSTYAYQGGGRQVDRERIRLIETWVQGALQPDLTFLFDAPLALARERVAKGTSAPDKFEREQEEFFSRVRNAYLERAKQFPDRIKIVDSSRSMGEIQADLSDLLDRLLSC